MNSPRNSKLRLLDAVCLIVGIVVGAGLYETAPTVASSVESTTALGGLWLLGAVISFCGSLSYAELATTYPEVGGDFAYLRRAFGPWAGFLFGWMQLTIVRPGDITLLAFAFARYAVIFLPAGTPAWAADVRWWACAAVIAFTVLNVMGMREAKGTQNIMTIGKVVGLLMLTMLGLWSFTRGIARDADWWIYTPAERSAMQPISPGVALVLILFCYGGWNEIAYVAAEVDDPARNIQRAMLRGMGLVAGLYLLANGAFVAALGHTAFAESKAVAVDVVGSYFPHSARLVAAGLVAASALGALHGQILTGARISLALGMHHRRFRLLGEWSASRGTPVTALCVQAVITLVLIVALGSFKQTLIYTAPTVYTFYFFTSIAVLVLRVRDSQRVRPVRLWGYPWTVLFFAGSCIFMVYHAVVYRPVIAAASLGIFLIGVPIYCWAEVNPDANPLPPSEPQA